MALKQSVVVEQFYNHEHRKADPKTTSKENPEYVYKVTKTINTLRVRIGQYLCPDEVETLLSANIQVTVNPISG